MYLYDEKKIRDVLERDIIPVLPERISKIIGKISPGDMQYIEEIRLRVQRPLMIFKGGLDYFVNEDGSISHFYTRAVTVIREDMERALQLMSDYSIYAVEDEIKQGFLTLRGGHRVGITGRGVIDGKKIKTIKNISGMNIRIAREVKGCGFELTEKLYRDGVKHTLIASPPGCGKTTLLRDVIRILSWGQKEIGIRGYKVGVVDERSEIAGCYLGIPQRDVGIRTDVLDACPKAQGMIMLLRSMSPEIIAVDEIGSLEDAEAIEDAVNAGVKVIATVHGRDMTEILKRPGVKNLVDRRTFEKIVILSRREGPGTIDEIIDV
ncbi:stage III sporulation protein AA [Fonticella tunisiensis]|uniref:Stage III sporulation protein AA n=1 Tax=Fonticella tunisiensis TaxID=1096341 RepID=A0A4R7KUH4_9CLOT|nr:stage III sporulation protein AA [Fonticella tunisiensis]TDT61954.1 stage III sporulation protein AA [Fonticella tunisiensis]